MDTLVQTLLSWYVNMTVILFQYLNVSCRFLQGATFSFTSLIQLLVNIFTILKGVIVLPAASQELLSPLMTKSKRKSVRRHSVTDKQ